MVSPENISLSSRKDILVPNIVNESISKFYKKVWRPGGQRGPEVGNPFQVQIGAFWIGDEKGGFNEILPLLPVMVEAVVRSGEVFRFMDVGSASYALFLTGFKASDYEEVRKGNVIHSTPRGYEQTGESINHFLIKSGFVPEKHFELIAVNGHSFAIPEVPGTKLITANIYGRIPGVEKNSINLITSFRTVYQDLAGFYLLERFDRYLKMDEDPVKNGLAVVWPFRQPITLIVDPAGKELKASTVMKMAGVYYWDPGEHASWRKPPYNLSFPVYASEFLVFKDLPPALVYAVNPHEYEKYTSEGGEVVYEENPRLNNLRELSLKIYEFRSE